MNSEAIRDAQARLRHGFVGSVGSEGGGIDSPPRVGTARRLSGQNAVAQIVLR
jgi:hypothetical protein